jgi:hypothetical protein
MSVRYERRPREIEGCADDAMGQYRNLVQSISDILANQLKSFSGIGDAAEIEFNDRTNVHRRPRNFQQNEGTVQRIEVAGQRPLLPKPPSPRLASGSSSTVVKVTSGTRRMTNWAIRSPFFTS